MKYMESNDLTQADDAAEQGCNFESLLNDRKL